MAVYTSDFETTTGTVSEKKTWVWLAGLYNVETEKFKHWWDIDGWYAKINKMKNSIIYFHNLGFDGAFIINYFVKIGLKFVDTRNPEEVGEFTFLKPYGTTKIFSMKLRNSKNNIIEFRCSWALLGHTRLDKIGEYLGFHKLSIDYHNITPRQEAVDYIERDCFIAAKAIERFAEWYKPKLTISSTSMNEFRQYYGYLEFIRDFGGYKWKRGGQKEANIVFTPQNDIMLRPAYRGGLVIFNPDKINQKLTGHFYHYDYNSHYPATMINFKMPYGPVYTTKLPKHSSISITKWFIHHAKKRQPWYPNCWPAPKTTAHSQGNAGHHYLSEIKSAVYWMTDREITALEKFYDVRKSPIKTVYMQAKYIFKEYLSNVMQRKADSPLAIEQKIHKFIGNTLYGKWCEKREHATTILKKLEPHEKISLIERWYRSDTGEFYVERSKTDTRDVPAYLPIGICTTAFARSVILNDIHANVDNFLYADTDSMVLSAPIKNVEEHPTKIGAMKLENEYEHFKYLGAKAYGRQKFNGETVFKIAGVTDSSSLTLDTFQPEIVIKACKKRQINLEGGKILLNQDYRINKRE